MRSWYNHFPRAVGSVLVEIQREIVNPVLLNGASLTGSTQQNGANQASSTIQSEFLEGDHHVVRHCGAQMKSRPQL